jgi:hypothetical protein
MRGNAGCVDFNEYIHIPYQNKKQLHMKNVIIFYDDETAFIDECITLLKENGFIIEIFLSAEKLLERVQHPENICLLVSELIVGGCGNNFKGKRKNLIDCCAVYLLDELDLLSDDRIKKIPKIVYTSWDHAQNGRLFVNIKTDARIQMALTKHDVLPLQLLSIVKGLVK